jgi:hypothetical protein
VQEAKELGIKVMVYAAVCLLPMYTAVPVALKSLKETGKISSNSKATPHHLFDLCGLQNLQEFDKNAAYSEKFE